MSAAGRSESRLQAMPSDPSADTPRINRKRRRLSRVEQAESEAGSSSSATRQAIPRRLPSRASSGSSAERTPRLADDAAAGTRNRSRTASRSTRQSSEDWVYDLVILQHPQRARACGFGDKDRRPLSPPPIIQLIVRTATGLLVDPSDVSIDHLLLTVDLWSADLAQSLNVVMHPGTTARPASPHAQPNILKEEYTMESRPSTAEVRPPTSHYPITGWGWSSETSRAPPEPLGPSPLTRTPGARAVQDALPVPSPTSPYFFPARPATTATASIGRRSSLTVDVASTLRPTSAPSPSAGLGRQLAQDTRSHTTQLPSFAALTAAVSHAGPSRLPLTLNVIRDPAGIDRHSVSTATTSPNRPSTMSSSLEDSIARPSWSTDSSRPVTDYSFGRSSTSTWNTSSISSDDRDAPIITGWPPPRPSTSGQSWTSISPAPPIKPPLPSVMVREATLTDRRGSTALSRRDVESLTIADPAASQSFSRVLVGAVCATCQRLIDANGDLGLFFFTHDLAIRTEGTFRLKFALSDLALLLGGDLVPGQKAPILAQAVSDPFSVYSAKRFPGVIPTTALTRLFAGQNVRLPTRQRRGAEGAGAEDAVEDDLAGEGEGEDEVGDDDDEVV